MTNSTNGANVKEKGVKEMEKEWTISDDLTEVRNIKSQLRQGLRSWVAENYHINGKVKRTERIIELTIETFLDENPIEYIDLLMPATEGFQEAVEARHGDFYYEDLDSGDIVSFIDKALSFGYQIGGKRSYNCRYKMQYSGLKPKELVEEC